LSRATLAGSGRERRVVATSVKLSVKVLRVTDPMLPFLTGNPVARTLLLAQFSVKPWALDGEVVLRELRSFLSTASVDDALRVLAEGPTQDGAVSTLARVVVGWGTRDLVTLPRQAQRLRDNFPMAEVEMYRGSGHFPYWDAPEQAVRTILRATSARPAPAPVG
jgi:hypothetical protein